MIKKIISLVIFLALANAAVRVGVVYFHDQQFKDAVRELSLFSSGQSEEVVRAKVMEIAAANQIPLDPDFVEVTRKVIPGVGDHSIIKVAYAVMVPVFPGQLRRFQFDYTTQ
jgi:Flp pilus assembly secretin CpaC